MKKDSIGNRMKDNYENRSKTFLTRRTPVIMRLDGKAFHTLTKKCNRPFDLMLIKLMQNTAIKLCQEIQGAKCAYVQSDEISILITDFDRLGTDAWFNYNVQKMTSVSASIATHFFHTERNLDNGNLIGPAYFDSRVFNIPKEEVNNYFIWRQKDWERNSLFMYANTFFSAKELHEKNSADKHEMLYEKGVNWAELTAVLKNGSFVEYLDDIKGRQTWQVNKGYPIFSGNDLIDLVYLYGECDESVGN